MWSARWTAPTRATACPSIGARSTWRPTRTLLTRWPRTSTARLRLPTTSTGSSCPSASTANSIQAELNPGASQDRACLQELGLTQDLWETTVQQMIDIWTDAFAYTSIDLSFQGTNYYLDKGNRQRMNDYAADQGVGLQHAKWHPDWEDMAIACTACWSRGKGMVDAPLRWENRVMVAIEYPDPPCRAQVVARRSTTPRRITGTWQPSSISRETFTRRASTHADVGAADHREPLRAGHDPNRA